MGHSCMTGVHFGHYVSLGLWLLTTDHDTLEFTWCDPKSGYDIAESVFVACWL